MRVNPTALRSRHEEPAEPYVSARALALDWSAKPSAGVFLAFLLSTNVDIKLIALGLGVSCRTSTPNPSIPDPPAPNR